ncbi:MAG: GGDEF domain-containing protein [Deltaproteobacteria bacterium]
MNTANQSEYIREENNLRIERRGNMRKDHELLSKISASLEKGKCVVLFYFDIAQFHEIEQGAGLEIAQHIIQLFNETLAHGLKELYKKKIKILAAESLWGDDFIVLTETTDSPNLATLEYLSTAYRKQIKESMNREFLRLTGREIDVHIGYAIIADSAPNVDVQLYNATKKAFGIAKGLINMQSVKYLPEFKEILAQKKLYSVYQPIISIRSAAVLGWEALIRGPENSYFQRPDNIFSFAEAEGLLFPLEKICRELALNNIGELGPDQKIFVNVHPNTINDPAFTEGETIRIIQNLHIKPKNIVFEITERHHIKDFISFNRTLNHYRDQGFLLAVDDLGCGFSTLQSIAEIRPDYIKIDMSLVRGIHKDGVKIALMETFLTFAEKIGCKIIAEGIEEEAELASLINIGVHYGQGYFFGKPTYPKQIAPEETYLKTLHFVSKGRHQILKHAFPIGDIVDETISIAEQMPVKDVKALFEENTALSGIVVVENNKPCGLVMRQHLDKHLGKKYGYALYYEKPICNIMDKAPLIVDSRTPIELVSQVAMNRSKIKLYDSIVITRDKLLQGIVSVQTLLDTMTRIRLELAKGANPLTGLPGNIAIEQEHSRCAKNDKPFSIVFIDLDNFKSYNDKYGFEKGDEVLLYTANLLKSGIKEYCNNDEFLGHIGGDDFIIFTTEDTVESLCRFLIEHFDTGIKDLYSPEDRKAGGIMAHDRSGQERWFPFISVSLAVLDCTAETGKDMKEISGKVPQLKQYAKSKPGSVYVRDRRSE